MHVTLVDRIHEATPAPEVVAELLGLEVSRTRPARGAVLVLCPWHAERTPSCVLTMRGARLLAFCHGCHEGGSIIDLVAGVRGIPLPRDFRAAADATAELLGVPRSAEPRRRVRKHPLAELAARVDDAADRWLRGLPVRDDSLDRTQPDALRRALDLCLELDEHRAAAFDRLTAAAIHHEATWAPPQ